MLVLEVVVRCSWLVSESSPDDPGGQDHRIIVQGYGLAHQGGGSYQAQDQFHKFDSYVAVDRRCCCVDPIEGSLVLD